MFTGSIKALLLATLAISSALGSNLKGGLDIAAEWPRSATHDCLKMPGSMSGNRHPNGCAGAVWTNGRPAWAYCTNRGFSMGRFPWWAACCQWRWGRCQAKPMGVYQWKFSYDLLEKRAIDLEKQKTTAEDARDSAVADKTTAEADRTMCVADKSKAEAAQETCVADNKKTETALQKSEFDKSKAEAARDNAFADNKKTETALQKCEFDKTEAKADCQKTDVPGVADKKKEKKGKCNYYTATYNLLGTSHIITTAPNKYDLPYNQHEEMMIHEQENCCVKNHFDIQDAKAQQEAMDKEDKARQEAKDKEEDEAMKSLGKDKYNKWKKDKKKREEKKAALAKKKDAPNKYKIDPGCDNICIKQKIKKGTGYGGIAAQCEPCQKCQNGGVLQHREGCRCQCAKGFSGDTCQTKNFGDRVTEGGTVCGYRSEAYGEPCKYLRICTNVVCEYSRMLI